MHIPSVRRAVTIGAAFLFVLFLVARLPQAAPAGLGQARPAAQPADPDPGVRPTRLIDRDEIRVSRIDLEPGAVRSVHAHDDVEYHVWTPVQGTFAFTMGSDKPVTAKPGQAFFMRKGTRHGFRNTGTTPGAVFEIFVKKSTVTADAGRRSEQELSATTSAIVAALLPGSAESR